MVITKKGEKLPELDYHAVTEQTKPNTLLNGSSGTSYPVNAFNMSSVGTGSGHVTIPSNLPTASCYTLFPDIGAADIAEGNL